jgi:hypothetical protein
MERVELPLQLGVKRKLAVYLVEGRRWENILDLEAVDCR